MHAMPWEFLDDGVTSDVTFRATGPDLDALFTAAAEATTTAMIEEAATTVRPTIEVPVAVTAPALDLLLMRFLDELLFYKDARGLVLRAESVAVRGDDAAGWTAHATLRGEPIDPTRHALAADVKAVTLYGLRVAPAATGWQAEVTLDV